MNVAFNIRYQTTDLSFLLKASVEVILPGYEEEKEGNDTEILLLPELSGLEEEFLGEVLNSEWGWEYVTDDIIGRGKTVIFHGFSWEGLEKMANTFCLLTAEELEKKLKKPSSSRPKNWTNVIEIKA